MLSAGEDTVCSKVVEYPKCGGLSSVAFKPFMFFLLFLVCMSQI